MMLAEGRSYEAFPPLECSWSLLVGEFRVDDSMTIKYRPVARNSPNKLRVYVLIYLKILSDFKNI